MSRPVTVRRRLRVVFAIPAVLGALTLAGLLAALFGDAPVWRWWGWIGLGTPLLVIALCIQAATRPPVATRALTNNRARTASGR